MGQERFRNKVAIVGASVSKLERRSDVSIAEKAVAATDAAIADAGLSRSDIDAVACAGSLPADNAGRPLQLGIDTLNSGFLIEHMGLNPVWWSDTSLFPNNLVEASLAIASGAVDIAVVNRTVRNPAGRYHGHASQEATGQAQWTAPYGFVGWVSGMAMSYKEYQQRYGARREHMATFVLQNRRIVQDIPEAYWHGKPLTFEEYMSARMISDPMCVYDTDIPIDGSCTFILAAADRAKDLQHKPVYLRNYAQIRTERPWIPGTLGALDEYYEGGFDLSERLWGDSGWKPADIDVRNLYNGFAMETWYWLETLGFCPQGEAWQFIQNGHIDPKGPFPMNTAGGSQGWGRMHGCVEILETYRQMSGRAGDRQLAKTETGLTTWGDPAHNIALAMLYSADPSF